MGLSPSPVGSMLILGSEYQNQTELLDTQWVAANWRIDYWTNNTYLESGEKPHSLYQAG